LDEVEAEGKRVRGLGGDGEALEVTAREVVDGPGSGGGDIRGGGGATSVGIGVVGSAIGVGEGEVDAVVGGPEAEVVGRVGGGGIVDGDRGVVFLKIGFDVDIVEDHDVVVRVGAAVTPMGETIAAERLGLDFGQEVVAIRGMENLHIALTRVGSGGGELNCHLTHEIESLPYSGSGLIVGDSVARQVERSERGNPYESIAINLWRIGGRQMDLEEVSAILEHVCLDVLDAAA